MSQEKKKSISLLDIKFKQGYEDARTEALVIVHRELKQLQNPAGECALEKVVNQISLLRPVLKDRD